MTGEFIGAEQLPPGLNRARLSPRFRRHWGQFYSKMCWKPRVFAAVWVLSLVSFSRSLTSGSDHPCPPQCKCDLAVLKATCSGAGLSLVPVNLPTSLKHLDLSNNSIQSVELNLPHLLTLNLSYNLLTQWNNVTSIQAQALINLDLQHNHFEILSDRALQNFPNIQRINMQNNHIKITSLYAFCNNSSLRYVDLRHNSVVGFDGLDTNVNISHVRTLDLSHNMLSQLSQREWMVLLDVQLLNLSFNRLTNIPGALHHNVSVARHHLPKNATLSAPLNDSLLSDVNETYSLMYSIDDNMPVHSKHIETLDLSNNKLQKLHKHAFQQLYGLKTLFLNGNKLHVLKPTWFEDLNQLTDLNLDANPAKSIPKGAFAFNSKMQLLTLSNMPNLTYVHYDAFAGLDGLVHLVLHNNRLLTYLHASTLNPLFSLQVLDISHSGLKKVFPDIFANASSLQTVNMVGNPIDCGCDSKWIFQWITEFNNTMPKFQQPENIICASPKMVANTALSDLNGFNFSCSPARVANYTEYSDAMFKVGSPGLLDCVPSGNPTPRITWITPRGHMVLHHPAYVNWLLPGPHHHTFHATHPWHEGEYEHDVPHSQRIYVLKNGSLYVDYMLRNDAGAYTCKVQNPYGNETIIIHVRLDYSMMMFSVKISVAVGYACALAFFCIAVLTAVLRYIAYFCSEEQREKRKSIREILASLDQYRIDKIDRLSQYKSEKFDKISAYKTEKFDKLSAFKSAKFDQLAQYKMAKVDKLRNYKTLSFSNLVHYVKGMREYYIAQMVRIKENCTLQSERLRENYTMKACAFKDFRSHKIDTMRENYAMQVLKIKDYGSSQVAKLREQYRSQHNHIIKLIELMDIGNCMHIVEAECMRTESMLFDPDELNFDFDTHPVHVPYFGEDKGESEYETAGSNVDINAITPARHKTREQKQNDHNELEALSAIGLVPMLTTKSSETKPHRHRKHRRCRRKRPIKLPSLDDADEDHVKATRKKRKKLKEKKPTFHSYDGDTTAPDTPPEVRSSSAVYATVHNHEGAAQSSEYESASAQINSREVTPDPKSIAPVATATPSTSVSGLADVGSAHNILDFTNPQNVVAEVEEKTTPVHRAESSHTKPSTATLTEGHVILEVSQESKSSQDTSSVKSLDIESKV